MKTITQLKLYDDLKELFNIDEESFNIFANLKSHTRKENEFNDILYLSPDSRFRYLAFKRFISKNNISYSQIDNFQFSIFLPREHVHIYFMTILDLQHFRIEAKRFKKIYFTI